MAGVARPGSLSNSQCEQRPTGGVQAGWVKPPYCGAMASGVLRGGPSAGKQTLALSILAVHVLAVWGPCGRKESQPAPKEAKGALGAGRGTVYQKIL